MFQYICFGDLQTGKSLETIFSPLAAAFLLPAKKYIKMMKKLFVFVLMHFYLIPGIAQQKSDNMIKRAIHSHWTFKEPGGKHSGPATVPGSIHTDLLANGMIEDPFYRTNEKDMQWIDKKDWEYSTVFNVSKAEFEKNNIVLNFEGLDTYADVYVNDHLILQALSLIHI